MTYSTQITTRTAGAVAASGASNAHADPRSEALQQREAADAVSAAERKALLARADDLGPHASKEQQRRTGGDAQQAVGQLGVRDVEPIDLNVLQGFINTAPKVTVNIPNLGTFQGMVNVTDILVNQMGYSRECAPYALYGVDLSNGQLDLSNTYLEGQVFSSLPPSSQVDGAVFQWSVIEGGITVPGNIAGFAGVSMRGAKIDLQKGTPAFKSVYLRDGEGLVVGGDEPLKGPALAEYLANNGSFKFSAVDTNTTIEQVTNAIIGNQNGWAPANSVVVISDKYLSNNPDVASWPTAGCGATRSTPAPTPAPTPAGEQSEGHSTGTVVGAAIAAAVSGLAAGATVGALAMRRHMTQTFETMGR